MSRKRKTAAVCTPLSDIPRREAKVIGVEFDEAEHFGGVVVYFDDGSRMFSHVSSSGAGISLDTLSSRLDSRMRAQDCIDCIEYLFNTSAREMDREEMLDLVEAALDEAAAEADAATDEPSVADLGAGDLPEIPGLPARREDPVVFVDENGEPANVKRFVGDPERLKEPQSTHGLVELLLEFADS